MVLGCPLPILRRWRVRIAVRSADRHRSRFVFSGVAVRTPFSEARMMADYAIERLGVPPGNVVIEDRSRTTVENVVNSAKLISDASMIMIASNTLHARRARQVMHAEQPELARRLVGAHDYIPLEWGPLHLLLVAFEQYREATCSLPLRGPEMCLCGDTPPAAGDRGHYLQSWHLCYVP